jgi:hypothetical protein
MGSASGPGTGGELASEPFATEENDRPRPLHVAGLADDDGTAVVAVRLFDSLNYRICIPGLQVRHPVQLSTWRWNTATAEDAPRGRRSPEEHDAQRPARHLGLSG